MPRLKYCPESKFVYWHTDGAGVVRVHRLPCKSWECPYCGREKYRKRRDVLVAAFQSQVSPTSIASSGSPSDGSEACNWPTHVILTVNPRRVSRKQVWATIGRRFDRFRRGLQRDAGGEAPVYVRVVAQHESHEYPHLHLLVFLPRKYREFSRAQLLQRLRCLWGPRDGGGLVDLGETIDSQQAMRRVIRYILLQLLKPLPSLPTRGRRVSFSRGIGALDEEGSEPKPPKRDGEGGHIRRGNISRATKILKDRGYWVTTTPVGIVAEPPRT